MLLQAAAAALHVRRQAGAALLLPRLLLQQLDSAALQQQQQKQQHQPQQRHASSLTGVIAPESGKTRLQAYLPQGFVVNGVQVEGAILCLPDTWLLWDAASLADVQPDSLAIVDMVEPRPEVLVLGCGARMRPVPAALHAHLAARGIAVEALDTRNAISYFNFLSEEGRAVVGALLPSCLDAEE